MKEIGKKFGTDKISKHGYHRFYPVFLEKFRKKKIVMLEVGIDEKKSLEMWKEYFTHSKVYGIDINS